MNQMKVHSGYAPVNVNPQGGPPGQTKGILTETKIDCQIPLGESTTQCQNSAKIPWVLLKITVR